MDKLVDCKRCGSNACLEQQVDEVTTWLCFGCGFTSSTIQTQDSKIVAEAIETAPELYKDLKFVDSSKYVWLPSTITLPAKGMVFLDGTSKDQWGWAAVLAVPILQEERDRFPSEQTHKMDMKGVKHYGQKGFMDALEHIGFFQLDG